MYRRARLHVFIENVKVAEQDFADGAAVASHSALLHAVKPRPSVAP